MRQRYDPNLREYVVDMDESPTQGLNRRRQREELVDDLDEEDWEEGVPEAKRRRLDPDGGSSHNQIYVMAFTWSYSTEWKTSSEEFCRRHDDLKKALALVSGKKGRFVFQLELTPPVNYHYQGYLNLTTKRRVVEVAKELQGYGFDGIHLSPSSTVGKAALRDYCMKSETRVAGPWGDRPIAKVYDGSDLPKQLYPWQQAIWDEIVGPVNDDRTINWVFDDEGCIGKSKLVKKAVFEKKAAFHGIADSKDTLCAVVKEGAQTAYLFDLPRTKSKKIHMDDVYSALESVKNGMVRGGKWENEFLLMEPPHIWVFSNYPPSREKMSGDRFKVRTIDRATKELVEHIPAPAIRVSLAPAAPAIRASHTVA